MDHRYHFVHHKVDAEASYQSRCRLKHHHGNRSLSPVTPAENTSALATQIVWLHLHNHLGTHLHTVVDMQYAIRALRDRVNVDIASQTSNVNVNIKSAITMHSLYDPSTSTTATPSTVTHVNHESSLFGSLSASSPHFPISAQVLGPAPPSRPQLPAAALPARTLRTSTGTDSRTSVHPNINTRPGKKTDTSHICLTHDTKSLYEVLRSSPRGLACLQSLLEGCISAYAEEDAEDNCVIMSTATHVDIGLMILPSVPAHSLLAAMDSLKTLGMNVDAVDGRGMSMLMHAARRGDTELVRTLLAAGADVLTRCRTGRSALMWAAIVDNSATAQMLLAAKADADAADDCGLTALMLATTLGHVCVINALAEAGADLNKQDGLGLTALMWAVMTKKALVIQTLLQWGVDVEVQDNKGGTAVMWAVACDDTPNTLHALLQAGAKADVASVSGVTVLMIAARKGKHDMMRAIIRHMACKCGVPVLAPVHESTVSKIQEK